MQTKPNDIVQLTILSPLKSDDEGLAITDFIQLAMRREKADDFKTFLERHDFHVNVTAVA
jgi:hypothetical protein